MLGAFLALLSAITFAFTNAGIRRGVLTGTVGQAMAISMPIGLLMFLVTTWAIGYLPQVAVFSPEALLWLCAAGAIHFVWGRYCNMRATKAMGANLVGPVQELNLVVSLVLAISILGETITPLRAFGIACVFLGPALSLKVRREPANAAAPSALPYGDSEEPPHLRPVFRPNYLEGYVFAFLSALGFGTSPIFVSMAIDSAGIGVSLAAGLVSYCAATLLLVPFLINPSTIRSIKSIQPVPARWFVASAIFVTLSQMFRYMALSVAPVIVVAPIMRLSLIFRLVFSRFINRDQEVFSGGVFLGTAISLMGALSLSVSTEFVLAYVRLPDYFVWLADWHWP